MGFFSKLFGGKPTGPEPGLPPEELARRLKADLASLHAIPIEYRELRIPKRNGEVRILHAPADPLKKIQRTILRRLLGKLSVHPAATGFERGQSIATNAAPHLGAAVVLKMDLRNFFTTTTAARVRQYFVKIGWGGPAADILVKLTTHRNGLPQGAPTSPRLSNLVNYPLDARLFAAALKLGAIYTRYADDMTFSVGKTPRGQIRSQNPKTLHIESRPTSAADERSLVAALIQITQLVVKDYGYHLHTAKKLRILRRHDRMLVTGLVVNDKLNLPRATRRRLRAVEHHLATSKPATLTPIQLQGWRSLQSMIAAHQVPSSAPPAPPPPPPV